MDITIDENMESPDLISNLPDEVLHSIISFLPAKEAVTTSIYSKRWRFLWKSLSRLSFDLTVIVNDDDDDDDTEFCRREEFRRKRKTLHKFLSSHTGNVEFFHLNHLPYIYWRYMPQFIELLKDEKGLREISLSCDKGSSTLDDEYEKLWVTISSYESNSGTFVLTSVLPESIFHGRFLRLVELNEYVLIDASPFKGCVNIKTLKFTACVVSEETLIDILGNCEFLKNLVLRRCSKSLKNLSIQHKKLELLEIHHMSVGKFYLLCESLTKMVLKDFLYSSKVSHIHCPKLLVLKTNNPELMDRWGARRV